MAEATNKAKNAFVAPNSKTVTSKLKRNRLIKEKAIGKTFARINLVFNIVDMGFTAASLIENIQEGDDAAAADAMLLTGATIGAVAGIAELTGAASITLLFGLSVSLPILGLVALLVSLAGYLAKTFLFTEDDPITIWLANGPFSRGNESHAHLNYRRASETITITRNGQSRIVGCTVHSYDKNKLYIDEDGMLVAVHAAIDAGIAMSPMPELFQQRSDGTIWMTPQRSRGTISQPTQVGQIGQSFIMPPCLQPTLDKETYSPRKGNPQNEKRRRAHMPRKLSRIETWFEKPKESYLALADALYRPRVTIRTHNYTRSGQILCDIDLPFFIPEKSKLFIEVDDSITRHGHATSAQNYDPEKRPLTAEEINNLKIGPNRYRIERVVQQNSSRMLEVRVRLNMYGNDEMLLPYEDKFDGNNIETDTSQDNKPAMKWICASTKMELR